MPRDDTMTGAATSPRRSYQMVTAKLSRRQHSSRDAVPALDKIGTIAFVALVAIGLFAPLLAPFDPTMPAGAPFTPPNSVYWLGTDGVGYDIASRVMYGLRASILAAAIVVGAGAAIGAAVGSVAGLGPRWLDDLFMRLTDLFLSVPAPLVAIAIVVALGPGYLTMLAGITIVWWPLYARIARSQIVATRGRPHTQVATLSGIPFIRRTRRHILPATYPTLITTMSQDIGALIVTISSLAFLGLGAPSPAPELGAMVARGLPYLFTQWWIPFAPAAVVFVLAFTASLAGDAITTLRGQGG